MVAQELVRIGSIYGNVSIESFVPHPTTISTHVKSVVESLISTIVPEIGPYLKNGVCAATTDMWSDRQNNAYIAMTLHYVSDDWVLTPTLLFNHSFPQDRHTGQNITRELRKRMAKFGFPADYFDNLTFVTDKAANMKKKH